MIIPCDTENVKLGDLVLFKYLGINSPPKTFQKIGLHYYLTNFYRTDQFWVGFVIDIRISSKYNNKLVYVVVYPGSNENLQMATSHSEYFVKAKFIYD